MSRYTNALKRREDDPVLALKTPSMPEGDCGRNVFSQYCIHDAGEIYNYQVAGGASDQDICALCPVRKEQGKVHLHNAEVTAVTSGNIIDLTREFMDRHS